MKTIQCITEPLTDSSFMQRVQNWSKNVMSSRSSSNGPDFYFSRNVSGDYNFFFTFRLEGGGFFQTGILVASATSKEGAKGLHVPLKCTWYRRVGHNLIEIPNISSNMYQISADDLGTTIVVSAQAADGEDGYWGTAIGEIGPFELDPSTRRSLDNAIGAGGSRFPVRYFKNENDSTPQDLVIHVMQDDVKVVQPGMTERFSKEVVACYTADYPKVIIHPLDTVKFQLVMNEEKTFHLAALSRTSRDLVALAIRCFHARKYISTSFVLNQLFNNGMGGNLEGAQQALDFQIMIARLTAELNRALAIKDKMERALKKTCEEKSTLDSQLHETITSYTSVIEHLQAQVQNGAGSVNQTNQQLLQKLREVERENSLTKSEMEDVRHRLLESQHTRTGDPFNDAAEDKAARLTNENQRLMQRLKDAESSAVQLELKRCRGDVERYHQEKEGLLARLRQAEQEKQELASNFHYVKGEMDKLQMRQVTCDRPSEGSCSSSSDPRYNQLLGERNRLASRLEQMCRDVERGKQSTDSQVDRAMAANGKLLEERDRLEKELRKMSSLYQDAVAQLRASAPDGGGSSADPTVHIRLTQQQDTIARLEQENASLKSRIRKLATSS